MGITRRLVWLKVLVPLLWRVILQVCVLQILKVYKWSVSQKILITIVAGKMIKYVNCRDNSTNQCITKIQIAVFFRKTLKHFVSVTYFNFCPFLLSVRRLICVHFMITIRNPQRSLLHIRFSDLHFGDRRLCELPWFPPHLHIRIFIIPFFYFFWQISEYMAPYVLGDIETKLTVKTD